MAKYKNEKLAGQTLATAAGTISVDSTGLVETDNSNVGSALEASGFKKIESKGSQLKEKSHTLPSKAGGSKSGKTTDSGGSEQKHSKGLGAKA